MGKWFPRLYDTLSLFYNILIAERMCKVVF